MALVSSYQGDLFVPILPTKASTDNVPLVQAVPVQSPANQSQVKQMTPVSAYPVEPNDPLHIDGSALEVLKQQGYSLGLAKSLSLVKQTFAKRIFIIDNSGSMQTNDGHKMVDVKARGVIKIAPCSRWEEIRECINYHIRLTSIIQAPTSFRLLNHPGAAVGNQIFGVAEDHSNGADADQALHIMARTHPSGCTPLTDHIHAIHQEVSSMAAELRAKGQRISITIATDGLPSDPYGHGGPHHNRAFVDALRRLEGLPVWLVIRLCTDEDEIVQFYNDLDTVLEVSVEVLDDFLSEANEVRKFNPWLNYGLPLQRLRELGFHDRVLDMLDERPLTLSELRDFCELLFGQDRMDGVPDPSVDWKGFLSAVGQVMKHEKLQWVSWFLVGSVRPTGNGLLIISSCLCSPYAFSLPVYW